MSLRPYLLKLRSFDWLLVAAVLVLCAFSLAALYGIATAFEPFNFTNLRKQAMFIAVGLGVMLAAAALNPHRLRQAAPFGYAGVAVLLVAVLGIGQTLRGTTGWFSFGGVGFQPVEVGKLALIVLLAAQFSARGEASQLPWRSVAMTGLATTLYLGLALLQPDLGSAIILLVVWLGMLFFAGASFRQMAAVVLVLLAIGAFGWAFLLKDYQRGRVASFLDPAADPYGRGYQVRQSIIAVGAGQFSGRGLGFGSQSQLKFIPASQTDFIFAVIGEELGFIGAAVVLTAYAVILARLVGLARRARDDFSAVLVLGVWVLLLSQVVINIGMNIGLLPVTGIGLPFLSYGGSYLVLTFALVGLVQAVAFSSVKYRV